MQNFELILHKGLPIITDKLGQKFILDTGSPISFCASGQLDLHFGLINVPKTIMNIDASYLCDNVGIQLDGLLGLDVLKKKSFSIHYNSLLFTIYNDINGLKVEEGLKYYEVNDIIFKLPFVINGDIVNIILDTGAHISYLNPEFVNVDTGALRRTNDFNPILGNFEVSIVDQLEYSLNGKTIVHEIGISPTRLVNVLNQFRAGGVFGYELFNKMDFYYLKEKNRIAIKFI